MDAQLPEGFKLPPPKVAALHKAVKCGTLREVVALLQEGVDPNAVDELFNVPLFHAAGRHRYYVARALLEAGADPNYINAVKTVPLHCAVPEVLVLKHGKGGLRPPSLRTAKLLLDCGADPDIADHAGRRAIDLAADPEAFRRLLAKQAAKRLGQRLRKATKRRKRNPL